MLVTLLMGLLLILSVVCNLWLVRALIHATSGNVWAIKTLFRMSPAKARKLIRDLETPQSLRTWHRRLLRDYEEVCREVKQADISASLIEDNGEGNNEANQQ